MPNKISTRKRLPAFRGKRGSKKLLFLKRLLAILYGINPTRGEFLIKEWTEAYQHVIKHEGKHQAQIKAKLWYTWSLNYVAGVSQNPIPWCRSNKIGFPKVLSFLKTELFSNDTKVQRGALCVLRLYLVETPSRGPYSLDSIVEPYQGQLTPDWIHDFDSCLKATFPEGQRIDRILALKEPGVHISGSKGPNGPAINSSSKDFIALVRDGLIGPIRRLASLTGNSRLLWVIRDMWAANSSVILDDDGLSGSCHHSRIRCKYENGGKVRLFCILDWFTQSALLGIHKWSMKWLYSHPCDGTKDHNVAAQSIRNWTKVPGSRFWSFDLTSATDRMPVWLLTRVVEHLWGPEIASAWQSVMVDRDFLTPDENKVRFMCGQPLGALSSWAVFAITHHILVRTAATRAGLPFYRMYRIIGDDVVLANSWKVAVEYENILKSLSLKISVAKSFGPELVSAPTAEIAKRLFREGSEITPIPPSVVEDCLSPVGPRNIFYYASTRGHSAFQSPYPVQTIGLSPSQFAALTFPIGNPLPPLGVSELVPFWERRQSEGRSPPAGLSPAWFKWTSYPLDRLNFLSADFFYIEVQVAMANCMSDLSFLYDEEELTPQHQGAVCNGSSRLKLFPVLESVLGQILVDLDDARDGLEKLVAQDTFVFSDFQRFVGRFHHLLDPDSLIRGIQSSDEKKFTSLVESKLIKFVNTELEKA